MRLGERAPTCRESPAAALPRQARRGTRVCSAARGAEVDQLGRCWGSASSSWWCAVADRRARPGCGGFPQTPALGGRCTVRTGPAAVGVGEQWRPGVLPTPGCPRSGTGERRARPTTKYIACRRDAALPKAEGRRQPLQPCGGSLWPLGPAEVPADGLSPADRPERPLCGSE